MKKSVIVISSIICASFFGIAVNAQNASLELSWTSGSWNPGSGPTQGPSIATQLQTFQNDALNNSNFSNNTPGVTVTTTLRNQVFTGYNYAGQQGTVTTGLSFGTSKSEWNDPLVTTQGPRKANLFDLLGANVGAHGPVADLYRSFAGEALGTIDADFSQFGADGNGGVTLFTTVEPLRLLPGVDKAGRYYYGELVINFSRKVKDPVINIASLGGSSWYQISSGAPWNMSYFTTELELVTPGLSSVRLSGTPYFDIQGNNILNNAARPNGDSQTGGTDVKGFSTFGSASGSVQVNGNVDSLVYKVYLRGSSLSDYPFTFDAISILGASRNPFYGDFWAISYSMKKPTQQISGNVFIDPQTTDNNINQSFGAPNSRTSAGGQLYANLISGGLVIATVPVSVNGDYLFDNVSPGTYTVQLSRIQGTVSNPPPANNQLPANWVHTGEFIGSGPGTDGTINGVSASITVAVSNIITNVNFGIRTQTCPQTGINGLVVGGNLNPTVAGNYGSFNRTPADSNFFPTRTVWNYAAMLGYIWAQTPLTTANYRVVGNTTAFDPALSSYNALGDSNRMMVIKPSAGNQVVYYIMDSVGLNINGVQARYKCVSTPFRGWFAKASAADATVRIKIYDRDDPTKVFGTLDTTLTGAAGNWIYLQLVGQINTCPNPSDPNQVSSTKAVRTDIIALNGAPFSIDELCHIPPPSPLPIALTEFTLSKSGCTVNLAWKTSQESNSDRFEVEVSTGNNPVYVSAGTLAAAGNSTETKTYRFSYPMQDGEVYYFRIKLIDKDGSFTYSTIQSANCTKGNGGVVIWPNPTVDIFTVRNMQNGKNKVQVYAANGQLVKEQDINQTQGNVNITGLAPGMYTVKVTNLISETSVVKKLIKY